MKRYLLFACNRYDACGGWRDLINDYNELERAKEHGKQLLKHSDDSYHIVDTEIQDIVHEENK